ncbi:MAG TPA: FecR domain-containing protein, partial [Polyangia bacterium]
MTTHAAQAARALAAIQPSSTPPPIADRAAAIDAIERALRSRARPRWRRWVLPSVAVVSAAAAAGLVLVIGSHRVGPPKAGSGPVASRISGDERLSQGAELRGPGSFELASGTRLRLDDRGGARVLEAGASRRFRLRTGALHAEVAKLSPGQRFVVETPDAEVEVKGTRFDVAVGPPVASCAPATETTVTVEEGVVAVRFGGQEIRLGPGQSWPSCPVAGGAAGAASSPVLGVEQPPARRKDLRPVGMEGRPRARVRPAGSTEGATPAAASTLAEQ